MQFAEPSVYIFQPNAVTEINRDLVQRDIAKVNQVLLAVDDRNQLPVGCHTPDEPVPPLLTKHRLSSSSDLLHSSLDPLGVAAEVGGLQPYYPVVGTTSI